VSLVREKVVQSAEKLVSRGKIESGIKEYRKLLDENPNDISTLNRVGDLYARINRNGEAIDLFSQIARRYTSDGFFVKAIAIYKKIIKLDPTRLDIYEELADLYHKQGLVTEARTQYQVLADYYQKHDNATSAIAICKKLVSLEPNDPSHHAKLAEIYQRQRLHDKAIEEYKTIAELMLSHGHAEQAAQVYERALDIASEDIAFITDAVLKLKEAGSTTAAARLLSVAIERNPKAERVARLVGGERPTGDTGVFARPVLTPPPAELPKPAAPAPQAPVVPPPAAKAAEEDPLGDFPAGVFELEVDDSPAASLVAPPPDMAGPGAAFLRPGEAPPAAVPPAPPPAAVAPPPVAATPPPAPAAPELPAEEDFVFELDLDASASLLLSDVGHTTGAEASAADLEPHLDHDLLERTAAEVTPSRALQVEDLLTEAEVLAKYGIEDKALERLNELLARDPTNLAGYRLAINLHLDRDRHEIVADLASKMARLADRTLWPEVRDRLEVAGYRNVNGRMEPPSAGREAASLAPVGGLADFEPAQEPAPPTVPGLDFGGRGPLELQVQETALPADEPAAFDATPTAFTLDFDELAELGEPARPTVPELPAVDLAPVSAPEMGFELADQSAVFELDLVAMNAAVEPPAPEPVAPEPPLVLETVSGLDDLDFGSSVEEPPAPPAAPFAPKPAPGTPPRKQKPAPVDDLLAQIRAGVFPRPSKSKPAALPAPAAPEVPARVAAFAGPLEISAPPARPAASPEALPRVAAAAFEAPATGGGAIDPLRALGQSLRMELDDDELSGFTFPVPGETVALPSSSPGGSLFGGSESLPASLDDTGTSWLDEVSRVREAPKAKLFENEKDFFDLGAELDQELSAEEQLLGGPIFTGAEQSLEEIVEGFKKGVAENLSTEDYDTHYNLGIAYREMGLLDEAVGEFQLASKSPTYLVSCASMLGLCFLEKNLPELAVKWYRRGLEAPGLGEEDQLGLLYDLGSAYLAAGDDDNAYRIFVEAYGINSNYRDLVARLAELGPREN
jgi:tetratricopeptide (TPR) repeat protein